MPVKSLILPLEQGSYYHIYNRGNNKDKLFYTQEDYEFFLRKYFHYLGEYVITYAYCLLPNHFHFLIYIKTNTEYPAVTNQFRKLFICHSRRINYQRRRHGCLLTRNYRREKADSESYLRNLILYIHYNPIRHGVSRNILHYPYSSFGQFINVRPIKVEKNEVIDWFDGYSKFLEDHHLMEEGIETGIIINDDE